MALTRRRYQNGDTYCSACKQIRYKRHKSVRPELHARYGRISRLRKAYGLEANQFKSLLDAQGGVCAVCLTDDWGVRGPHVDHDHSDITVRGLLCHRCNTALGLFKDSEDRLLSAIAYLSAGKSKGGRKK